MTDSPKPLDPWSLRLLFLLPIGLGGFFIVLGILLGILIGGETTLMCDRAASERCELTHANLIHSRSQSFSLDGFRRADVESHRDSEGDLLYRVVMVTAKGPIPLTDSFSSGLANYQQQADQINQFLETKSQPTLELRQSERWLGWIFFAAFSGSGLIVLVVFSVVLVKEWRNLG